MRAAGREIGREGELTRGGVRVVHLLRRSYNKVLLSKGDTACTRYLEILGEREGAPSFIG